MEPGSRKRHNADLPLEAHCSASAIALASGATSGHYAPVAAMIDGDAEGWTFNVEPRRVDHLQLDFRFGIALDDGTLIVIESPFLATLDGVEVTINPETLDGVGAAFGVLHRDMTLIRAFRSGALRVELAYNGILAVAPGDAYENWQVSLPDGTRFVGLPGGGVATFAARE